MLREVDTVAFHAGHGADTPRDNRTDQQNREYALHRFLLSHVLFLSRMSASSWPRCWHVSDRKRSHGNLDSSTWRRSQPLTSSHCSRYACDRVAFLGYT